MSELDEVAEAVEPQTDEDFWFVILFVDGPVKHGFYEGTSLRMSAKAMDTIRYGMVKKSYAPSREEAVEKLVEAYEPEIRERIRTAQVMEAMQPVEVRRA